MNTGIPLPPHMIAAAVPATQESADKISEDTKRLILKKHLHPDHFVSPIVLQFIDSYLHNLDVRQAALECGISYREAKGLKNRPDIHDAISDLTRLAVDKYGYSAEEVVERVKEVLDFDPAVLENADGTFKESFSEIPKQFRTAIVELVVKNEYGTDINGLRTVTGHIVSYKFEKKLAAAKMLGPEKNVFKDSVDVNVNHKISITGALADAEKNLQIGLKEVNKLEDVKEAEVISEQ